MNVPGGRRPTIEKDQHEMINGARLAELPKISEAPPSERTKLCRQKIRLCCTLYDFCEPNKHLREKEAKKNTLMEIIEYITPPPQPAGAPPLTAQQRAAHEKKIWQPGVATDLLQCAVTNIFRPLGKRCAQTNDDQKKKGQEDEDEEVLEEAWPHLNLVYEMLLRLVLSKAVTKETAKEFFGKKFMIQFLNLLDSEDPRERDYLKTILHRIYGKSMDLRLFIRRAINDVFYTFVYETESFNGVMELLEILGSIINGFALPLKPEHQRFLQKTLIPLHKVAQIAPFHQQLSYCIVQFVIKDPQTAAPIILGLLRYWPITASAKEVLFLNELEEILELTQPDQFSEIVQPLFNQLSRSMCSPHFQVSQRALYLWNNECIVSLVALHRVEILPIIFAPLYHNCENHWHPQVKTLTYNVLKLFMEMDSLLFDQCSAKYADREGRIRASNQTRTKLWIRMEQATIAAAR